MAENILSRPKNSELEKQKKNKKKAEKELRQRLETEGFKAKPRESIPNCKCPFKDVDEERIEREEATTEQLRIMKA